MTTGAIDPVPGVALCGGTPQFRRMVRIAVAGDPAAPARCAMRAWSGEMTHPQLPSPASGPACRRGRRCVPPSPRPIAGPRRSACRRCSTWRRCRRPRPRRPGNRRGGWSTPLRAKRRAGGVEGLIQEYALSSQEGVALMCLAEALLRIPDTATARRADPRQDRRRRLARASRPQPVAVRQRRDLGPAGHRQAGRDAAASAGLSARADPPDRAGRRAADPHAASTSPCG